MTNPLVRERRTQIDDGSYCTHWIVWCPACDRAHRFAEKMYNGSEGWLFEGTLENPTWSPSLLTHYPTMQDICHSFVRNGVWEFLGDCTHDMAGQHVPMVPLPDFLAG